VSGGSDSLPGETTSVASGVTPPGRGGEYRQATAGMPPCDSDDPGALQPALAALAQSGADRFDPVRFHLIGALARRARDLGPPAGNVVAQKALETLRQYEADLARARGEAAEILARLRERHPDAAETAGACLERNEFRALRRLAARLERRGAREALSGLTGLLDRGASTPGEDSGGASLDELLYLQELELVQSLAAAPLAPPPTRSAMPGGLRSARAMAAQGADRLLARALGEMPEEPGPLNPQMLVTRSLSALCDLSPHYARRYITYVDTMLWLAGAGEKKG
jgi:hypothetical protein